MKQEGLGLVSTPTVIVLDNITLCGGNSATTAVASLGDASFRGNVFKMLLPDWSPTNPTSN